MFEFLSLHLGTIIIGLLVLAGILGAVIYLIRTKRKGGCTGCGNACPHSATCSHKNVKEK